MGTLGQTIGGMKRAIKKLAGLDDYNWDNYPRAYQEQLSEVGKEHTLKLRKGDYAFASGHLSLTSDILPLHPNLRLIHETILQLQPSSVMEFGCGAGYNLYNIMILSPNVKLYGCDRSQAQLDFARDMSPSLRADMRLVDISDEKSVQSLPRSELVFAHAVFMHIRGRRYIRALENIFRIATVHVLLIENWSSHNFLKDMKLLQKKKTIPPWNDAHFYYRVASERTRLMVVSTQSLGYPNLDSYQTLLNPLTQERTTLRKASRNKEPSCSFGPVFV